MLFEEVLSHSSLLDTITAKSAGITENYVAQLELQDLQERYNTVRDNAKVLGFYSIYIYYSNIILNLNNVLSCGLSD